MENLYKTTADFAGFKYNLFPLLVLLENRAFGSFLTFVFEVHVEFAVLVERGEHYVTERGDALTVEFGAQPVGIFSERGKIAFHDFAVDNDVGEQSVLGKRRAGLCGGKRAIAGFGHNGQIPVRLQNRVIDLIEVKVALRTKFAHKVVKVEVRPPHAVVADFALVDKENGLTGEQAP